MSPELETRFQSRFTTHPSLPKLYQSLVGSRIVASPLAISGLLTLLSKCFSTFPHGTCLLSISCQYLAMDGGYHPICALLPKSVTHSINTVRQRISATTGLSPSVACFPITYAEVNDWQRPWCTTPSSKLLGFTSRAHPTSLAATEGIPVGFFSSA